MNETLRHHWTLDETVTFLNHGSFGACPRAVLLAQSAFRAQLEAEPVRFFLDELDPLWQAARATLATFLGVRPAELCFVPSATHGVNAVLRSLEIPPGAELLTTDHGYNACNNALAFVAKRAGARVVSARIPFPCAGPDQVVESILAAVTDKTYLALIDHVTSPTGLVLPIERVVGELRARGIDTLVDGAHGPGMLELDITKIGAAYYTGNCHKWLCAPKGSGFLWVESGRLDSIRPAVTSHGANMEHPSRSRFQLEFDWTGTFDPTAVLALPVALETLGGILDGGFAEVRRRCRDLCLRGRRIVADALGVELPCPDSMIGTLATLRLPPSETESPSSPLHSDPLRSELLYRYGIEVPVVAWPKSPGRIIRISAWLYNDESDYRRLAAALSDLGLGAGGP